AGAVLLRRAVVVAGQFGIAEPEFGMAADVQVDRPVRKPAAALVRLDQVRPDAFDRAGQAAPEADRAGLGEGAVVVHVASPSMREGRPDAAASSRNSASSASSRPVQNFA